MLDCCYKNEKESKGKLLVVLIEKPGKSPGCVLRFIKSYIESNGPFRPLKDEIYDIILGKKDGTMDPLSMDFHIEDSETECIMKDMKLVTSRDTVGASKVVMFVKKSLFLDTSTAEFKIYDSFMKDIRDKVLKKQILIIVERDNQDIFNYDEFFNSRYNITYGLYRYINLAEVTNGSGKSIFDAVDQFIMLMSN